MPSSERVSPPLIRIPDLAHHATAAAPQIAVDGPSASGKSTVGKLLAAELGFDFLDTGLMYRAVTQLALTRGAGDDDASSIADADALGVIARRAAFAVRLADDGDWRLVVDGRDLTDELHSARINRYVSPVSAVSAVRRALVARQRRMATDAPIVMVGRDIGTVVLPNAPLKIYLDASAETRARRRVADAAGNVEQQRYEAVLDSIAARDAIDSTRADSPLRPADDAVVIATDELTIRAVVDAVMRLARARIPSASRHARRLTAGAE